MAARVGTTLFLAAVLKTELAAASCCCQEHEVEGSGEALCFKGNSEDKKKKRFMADGKDYCCKARSGSGCDRYKYTIPTADLSMKPTTITWMDEFGTTTTENSVLLDDTCDIHEIPTTTATTTVTTVTTATTIDPHRFEDISKLFGTEKTATIKDVEYRCCCAVNEEGSGVKCGVAEDKRAGVLNRLGCGSLFGTGYHSFLEIAARFPEFEGKEHANQCWVKVSELPEPVAEAATPSVVVV